MFFDFFRNDIRIIHSAMAKFTVGKLLNIDYHTPLKPQITSAAYNHIWGQDYFCFNSPEYRAMLYSRLESQRRKREARENKKQRTSEQQTLGEPKVSNRRKTERITKIACMWIIYAFCERLVSNILQSFKQLQSSALVVSKHLSLKADLLASSETLGRLVGRHEINRGRKSVRTEVYKNKRENGSLQELKRKPSRSFLWTSINTDFATRFTSYPSSD